MYYNIQIMDRMDFELARASLEVYDGLLSPLYRDMSEQLAGRLATNQMQIEGMREADRASQRNYRFIKQFVQDLPGSRTDAYEAKVYDAADARKFAANTVSLHFNESELWLRDYKVSYYLLGRRSYGESAISELLLGTIGFEKYEDEGDKAPVLAVVRVWDDEFDKSYGDAQRSTTIEYTQEELQERFDADSGYLRVAPATNALLKPARYKTGEPKQHWSARKFHKVSEIGINAHLVERPDIGDRITDEDLGSFRVLDNLNRLAVAFRKTNLLTSLLDECAQDAERTAIHLS